MLEHCLIWEILEVLARLLHRLLYMFCCRPCLWDVNIKSTHIWRQREVHDTLWFSASFFAGWSLVSTLHIWLFLTFESVLQTSNSSLLFIYFCKSAMDNFQPTGWVHRSSFIYSGVNWERRSGKTSPIPQFCFHLRTSAAQCLLLVCSALSWESPVQPKCNMVCFQVPVSIQLLTARTRTGRKSPGMK